MGPTEHSCSSPRRPAKNGVSLGYAQHRDHYHPVRGSHRTSLRYRNLHRNQTFHCNRARPHTRGHLTDYPGHPRPTHLPPSGPQMPNSAQQPGPYGRPNKTTHRGHAGRPRFPVPSQRDIKRHPGSTRSYRHRAADPQPSHPRHKRTASYKCRAWEQAALATPNTTPPQTPR